MKTLPLIPQLSPTDRARQRALLDEVFAAAEETLRAKMPKYYNSLQTALMPQDMIEDQQAAQLQQNEPEPKLAPLSRLPAHPGRNEAEIDEDDGAKIDEDEAGSTSYTSHQNPAARELRKERLQAQKAKLPFFKRESIWDGEGEFDASCTFSPEFLRHNHVLPLTHHKTSFFVIPDNAPYDLLKLLNEVAPGTYILRAQVDDIQSMLEESLPDPATLINEDPSNKITEISKAVSTAAPDSAEELLTQAAARRASDIHLEPQPDGAFAIRLRIDGVLHTYASLPQEAAITLISQFKILSSMDIAEQRLPQDGHFKIDLKNLGALDVRANTLPDQNGEDLALRLLPRHGTHNLSLEETVLSAHIVDHMTHLMSATSGLFLMTGPTGSGKTTTLYAALEHLKNGKRKIVTLEDPVEYDLPGITQVQVHTAIGRTFTDGLRSILRHDPDVLLIGEIRDKETAAIAVQAALTGHLVLSTLHTNSALNAIIRLLNMGIPDYLLHSSLVGVAGQRLVRRLCPACTEKEILTPAQQEKFGNALNSAYTAVGCPQCSNIGYKGLIPIAECMPMTKKLKDHMLKNPTSASFEKLAQQEGHEFLSKDAALKIDEGLTSTEEIARVLGG